MTAVRKYDDGGSVVIIIQLCSVAKQFISLCHWNKVVSTFCCSVMNAGKS